MALATGVPDLSVLCIGLDTGPGQLCITMPGGAQICAYYGLETGDYGDITRGLLAQLNTALAPLTPFFQTVDVIKQTIDCLMAIPDCITSLNPQPLAQCIPDLVEKLQKLLALIPQLSVPVMVRDIIDVLIVVLIAYKLDIEELLKQQARILAAATRAAATGNVVLQTSVDCATGDLDAALQNMNDSFQPLNRLVGVVNLLLELASLPALPSLDGLNELSEDVLIGFDLSIQLLETAKAALPV